MNFENPAKLDEFLRDRKSAYDPMAWEIRRRMMICVCMYAGAHWLTRGDGIGQYSTNYLNRLPTQWTADGKLRVAVNRINKFAQKVAAATFADQIYIEVSPPERDSGIPGSIIAQVMESMANTAVDYSNLLTAWRKANFFRVITGSHGIGLSLTNIEGRNLDIGGQQVTMPDQRMKAFNFDFTRLILDPARMNVPLHEHDEIIYSDVWTVAKIKRVMPDLQLNENALKTIGQLENTYFDINRLSGGRMYAAYAQHSRTKGARIYQVHTKGDDDRFGTMYIGVEIDAKNVIWKNFENPVSPFGGNGLPLMLLRGHPSGDGFGDLSDVEMMKDDQDRLNLIETFRQRMMQKNAGAQWLVDVRSVPNGTDPEAFSRMFHNSVFGVIKHEGPTRDRPVTPPQLVKYPDVPPFVQQMVESAEDSMRKQVHRSDANFGVTQTHTPNASFQRALEEADEVLGQRVREDIESGNVFCKMLLGTAVKMAQNGFPSMLGAMTEAGMDESDIQVVLQSDGDNPPCGLSIRESTVRYRSHQSKIADLDKALQMQAIDPFNYRIASARDIDTPITSDDKFYVQEAQKAAFQVLMGAEWEPVALGPDYSNVFISEFRKAAFDKRAKADPETRQRLQRAIVAQIQAGAAEQALIATITQPQVGGEPAQQQTASGPTQTSDGGEQSIGDVLAAIDSRPAA